MNVERILYMLMAQEMGRAVRFYRDVFGLEISFESPEWSELRSGDAIVALHGGGDGARTKTGLSFQVADLDEACAEVTQGGGDVLSEPASRPGEPIRLADLVDTEGNEFTMTQYIGGDH